MILIVEEIHCLLEREREINANRFKLNEPVKFPINK